MNEALSEGAPATVGGQRRDVNRKRNRSIDIARGAALVGMVFVHSAWYLKASGTYAWAAQEMAHFFTPLFVLLMAAMVSYHYLPRWRKADWRGKIAFRLLYRVGQILLLSIGIEMGMLVLLVVGGGAMETTWLEALQRSIQFQRPQARVMSTGLLKVLGFFLFTSLLALFTERIWSRRWWLPVLLGVVFLALYTMLMRGGHERAANLFLPDFRHAVLAWFFPYCFGLSLGLVVGKLTDAQKTARIPIIFLVVGLALLACWALWFTHILRTTGRMWMPREAKYPPTVYYFTYAIGVSLVLMAYFFKKRKTKVGEWLCSILEPIGGHSLAVYLGHFVVLGGVDILVQRAIPVLYGRPWPYIPVFIFATAVLYYLSRWLDRRNVSAKKARGTVLAGGTG